MDIGLSLWPFSFAYNFARIINEQILVEFEVVRLQMTIFFLNKWSSYQVVGLVWRKIRSNTEFIGKIWKSRILADSNLIYIILNYLNLRHSQCLPPKSSSQILDMPYKVPHLCTRGSLSSPFKLGQGVTEIQAILVEMKKKQSYKYRIQKVVLTEYLQRWL